MKRKKIIASILTAVTMISSLSIGAFAAKDAEKEKKTEFTAFLMYADAAGNWQLFDAKSSERGNCKVNGDGTYTVSVDISDTKYKKAANKASVFCIDIIGLAKQLEENKVKCNNYERIGEKKVFKMLEEQSGVDVKVGNIQIKVDGENVKNIIEDRMYYGNIEEAGTFRIELANDYGATKTGKGAVRVDEIAPEKKLEVTFTLAGTGMGTPATIAPKATPKLPGSNPTTPLTLSGQAADTPTNIRLKNDDSGLNIGAIVGSITAAVIVVGVVVVVVRKRKKTKL
ncbi:MAG: hypothetical protein Q4G58_04435 [bacterium]|nr:hypothetical protein [bacterium]